MLGTGLGFVFWLFGFGLDLFSTELCIGEYGLFGFDFDFVLLLVGGYLVGLSLYCCFWVFEVWVCVTYLVFAVFGFICLPVLVVF